MRQWVFGIALILVIIGAAYVGLNADRRAALFSLFQQVKREAAGYTPAKTPDDALQKFRKAIKDRDYDTAATYCANPYAEQLRKLDQAKELAESIDNLKSAAEKRDIRLTERVSKMLREIDPFPTTFEIVDIKEQGDQATAVLTEKGVWSAQVSLKREGTGNDKSWKIHAATTPWMRLHIDRLVDKSKDFTNALKKVIDQIRGKEIMTKGDLEAKLENELRDAEK